MSKLIPFSVPLFQHQKFQFKNMMIKNVCFIIWDIELKQMILRRGKKFPLIHWVNKSKK